MRPIKFRGRDNRTGKYVFGSYCRTSYCDLGVWHAIIDEGGEEFIVDPETVAQLVGYDVNGSEVYEGDIFVVPCGTEISATMFNNITENSRLKEATK